MRVPLVVELRPSRLIDVVGQDHLVGPHGALTRMIKADVIQNTLLWGPPGSGKTTIAIALANELNCQFRKLNATTSGTRELRSVLNFANTQDKHVVLAVDELHRWSKNVQDLLLDAVEQGSVLLIGLTVETAKFAVIKALLSRCLVLETKPLDNKAMVMVYAKVKDHYRHRQDPIRIELSNELVSKLIRRCNGDARKLIMVLETLVELSSGVITEQDLDLVLPTKNLFFDRSGSEHFDNAHAYQEAIQHSDVDGAIYHLARWIESGEDPAYICRRMLVTAFEDCAGNPFAVTTAMAAAFTVERIGLPEAIIPMSLATCEMAKSKRNKSAYYAIKEAIRDVRDNETVHIPPELRAGTTGYTKTINKVYLRGWSRDWSDDNDTKEP